MAIFRNQNAAVNYNDHIAMIDSHMLIPISPSALLKLRMKMTDMKLNEFVMLICFS